MPHGSASNGKFAVAVTPESAGWTETSLWICELAPGEQADVESGTDEIIVLPLRGGATVTCGDEEFALRGRPSVFAGPSDFAYVGRDSEYTIATEGGGRFALCGARAAERLPFRYVSAADVSVELRGAGDCSREVRNFGTADAFAADSIIACEVFTPGGNWSSYPSHKHDEDTADESQLEEIYYFEIAGPEGGFGYHRVYGTPERPIDVLAEVGTGDVVLVPHGYHGPSIAAPGHDMYYLNVMAGPGAERAWKIVDDPARAWVRDSWQNQELDPRLTEKE
ncbi:5-deoxy-glucuronate isomerase [Antrihabitans sp. YC2-6]|nr:5-deoxy-glucuronate isomerase [Antrihabitans sp. YC2-6]